MGFRDGSEDVRGFQLAALEGHVTPVKSLLLRSSMGEARLVGDVAGNWKLAKAQKVDVGRGPKTTLWRRQSWP